MPKDPHLTTKTEWQLAFFEGGGYIQKWTCMQLILRKMISSSKAIGEVNFPTELAIFFHYRYRIQIGSLLLILNTGNTKQKHLYTFIPELMTIVYRNWPFSLDLVLRNRVSKLWDSAECTVLLHSIGLVLPVPITLPEVDTAMPGLKI